MQKFIKNVLFFLSIPTIVLLALFTGLTYLNKKSFDNYRLNADIHTLFIGDSHVQMAINDSLLPFAKNLSQNSESFKFSYYKLETLLKQNPSVKNVYLGCGYHSLSDYNDDYIFGIYSKDISARYFFILPFREQLQTMVDNRKALPTYIRNIFELGAHNITQNKQPSFLGFYENTFENACIQDKSMSKRIQNQFFDNGRVRGFSATNFFYLTQIIKLCQNNQIQLRLINTPIHPIYKSKIPQKFLMHYDSIVTQSHLSLFDFNNLNLKDSCFIPDGDHVSASGALLVTNYFIKQQSNLGFSSQEK
jgi:hypothetical protein